MSRMRQSDYILKHLQVFGPITPGQALDEYGIMRLGARIFDLRRAGHKIESALVAKMNRMGQMVHVSEYRLTKDLR